MKRGEDRHLLLHTFYFMLFWDHIFHFSLVIFQFSFLNFQINIVSLPTLINIELLVIIYHSR